MVACIKMAPMANMGERARQARDSLGLTQADVARAVSRLKGEEVKPGSINQLENGVVGNPTYLGELAQVLKVNLQWLRTGKGFPGVPADTSKSPQKLEYAKLAQILDEIDIYERENKLKFSNLQRSLFIKRLYESPAGADYQVELAEVIELSAALRTRQGG